MDSNKSLSLGKSMLWNSTGSLIYLGCNWLTTVLVVLIYPTLDASGYLASAMAVGNVVTALVLFKVRAFQVSDVKNEFSNSDYIATRVICSIAGIIFGLLYALATVSEGSFTSALAYTVFKVIESFVDVFHGIDQRHNRLDIAGISQIIRGALCLLCFVSISYLTLNLTLALTGMALVTLLVVSFYDIPATRKLDKVSLEFNPAAVRKLFSACFAGFASSILTTMTVSLSRQLFGLEFGDCQLGIYAAIATPTVIVQAAASYIYAPMLGSIAVSYHRQDFKKLKLILIGVLLCLCAITLLAAIMFLIFADPLFTLIYGPEIASYAFLIQPIVLSTGLTAIELFVLDILIVFRKKLAAIFTCFLSFALALILIMPLSTIFGMNGISFTICIAYMCGLIASIPPLQCALHAPRQDEDNDRNS